MIGSNWEMISLAKSLRQLKKFKGDYEKFLNSLGQFFDWLEILKNANKNFNEAVKMQNGNFISFGRIFLPTGEKNGHNNKFPFSLTFSLTKDHVTIENVVMSSFQY